MYSLKTKNQQLSTNYSMNPYVTDEEIKYIVGNL
jgi:hypothetical protein